MPVVQHCLAHEEGLARSLFACFDRKILFDFGLPKGQFFHFHHSSRERLLGGPSGWVGSCVPTGSALGKPRANLRT